MNERKCGECNVCCVIGEVPELSKPPHTPCIFIKQCKAGSCSIFNKPELPKVCKSYDCMWKKGFGEAYGRPDKNKVLFSSNILEGQTYITAIETEKNAITGLGENMALSIARETHVPIIVVKYGVKPPNDRGDWVIITESTLPKCKRIAGKEIYRFHDDIAMYELLKGK